MSFTSKTEILCRLSKPTAVCSPALPKARPTTEQEIAAFPPESWCSGCKGLLRSDHNLPTHWPSPEALVEYPAWKPSVILEDLPKSFPSQSPQVFVDGNDQLLNLAACLAGVFPTSEHKLRTVLSGQLHSVRCRSLGLRGVVGHHLGFSVSVYAFSHSFQDKL